MPRTASHRSRFRDGDTPSRTTTTGHVITESGFTLDEGMDLAGISFSELYSRYLGLGGAGTESSVRSHLADDAYGNQREHNTIAQALNEVFLERGHRHPVGYRGLRSADDVEPS